MIVPAHIRNAYTTPDPEAAFFLDHFDEPPGATVLEVGAHDAPLASMLTQAGFKAVSVDLRPLPSATHYHIVGDFCALDLRDQYDCIISVSAIEHFGMGCYDSKRRAYYDVVALRKCWELLKPGGTCYIVVPYGGKYVEVATHWRVYDWAAVAERLVQDFKMEMFLHRVVEQMDINGRTMTVGTTPTLTDIMNNMMGHPYIAALLKLRK